MGKLILIEGTDCSGKETQTQLLYKKLTEDGYKVATLSFPMYNTPTGKIVGGPYLGKNSICEGWFPEGANNVPAKVASMLFAMDRYYNIDKITSALKDNDILLIDRYTTSNMGHQAGKIDNKEDRNKMYEWLEDLEYELLGLPRPDLCYFLYMPYKYASILKENRSETDQHEQSVEHLMHAENVYLELVKRYNFIKVDCVSSDHIRSINNINEEIYNNLIKYLKAM